MEKEYKSYSVDLTLKALKNKSGRAWVEFNPYDLFNAAESLLAPIEKNTDKALDREQVRQDLITTTKISDMLHNWNQQGDDVQFPKSVSEIFQQFSKDKCSISGFAVEVECRTKDLQKTLGLHLK